jgi:hypothetical protein
MTVFVRSEGIHSADIEDGSLVLLHGGSLFHLNPSGALLWTALVVEHMPLDHASRLVAAHFAVSEQRVREDAARLLVALRDAGLTKVAG